MPTVTTCDQPLVETEPVFIDERSCEEGWIETYLDLTRNHEATRKVHRWSAISVIAGALERKVWIDRGSYHLFPNLYVFIVGASGVIRKSTSTSMAVRFLRDIESMRIMSERVTAASLIHQLYAAGTTFETGGKKIMQSATYAYSSELIVLLKENFGSIQELLTTFYDCQPQDSSKPWVYETRNDGAIKIHGPCLNILGATTSEWLVQCVPAEQMKGGFASRVIFVVENEIPKPVAIPRPPKNHLILESQLSHDLNIIHSLTGEMILSEKAEDYFVDLYENYLYPATYQNNDGRMTGYLARKHDTILKIAQVFSASESNDMLIRVPHIERARHEIEELEALMIQAFAVSGKNELAPHMRTVTQKVRKAGTITLTTLLVSMWQDTSEQQLRDVIENLRKMGVVEVHQLGQDLEISHVQGAREL